MKRFIDNLEFIQDLEDKYKYHKDEYMIESICKRDIESFKEYKTCPLCENRIIFSEFLRRNTNIEFFNDARESLLTVKEILLIWCEDYVKTMCCFCYNFVRDMKLHKKLLKKYEEKNDISRFYESSPFYWGNLQESEVHATLIIMKKNARKFELNEIIPYIDYILLKIK